MNYQAAFDSLTGRLKNMESLGKNDADLVPYSVDVRQNRSNAIIIRHKKPGHIRGYANVVLHQEP